MDTTQTNREDRRSRAGVPQSAQQRNSAARTPEEQRSAAARQAPAEQRQTASGQAQAAPRQRPAPQQQAAAKKRPAPEQKQTKKRPAPEQKQAKKRPAPEQKQAKKRPAPEQRQAAPKQTGLPDSVSNKKRAYGNSKPKKKSAFATLMGNVAKAAAQKQEAKAKQAEKKPKRPKQSTPVVIYTQPQAFNRNRLFIQLLTVTAVVAALVLGLSVFFKVENITVTGAEVYTAWTVREASGISEGDNLLTFSHAKAGAKIKANLPYVNTVRFGIKLPDTVNIIIEEDDVVYAIQDTNAQWWLMNSGGRVVEQCTSGKASNYTQILGVTLDSPMADAKAVAVENAPTQTDPTSGELIPVTTTGAQRLTAALEIVRALEDNDIVGSAASVDVTTIEDIVLWYGTRYQVNLGEASNLTYKVACMNDAILQLSDFQSGILDISFTIWPDRVIYTPFG